MIAPDLAGRLARYLELLARWNRKLNLTALDVETGGDDAIGRLIVEPVAASERVLPSDRTLIDIGSGGGSPAIPIKLAWPGLQLVMVESRARKAAFLSEVVRQLGLKDTRVEAARIEEAAGTNSLKGWADVATLRAVRADRHVLDAVFTTLRPGGRLFWFTTAKEMETVEAVGHLVTYSVGGPGGLAALAIITRH